MNVWTSLPVACPGLGELREIFSAMNGALFSSFRKDSTAVGPKQNTNLVYSTYSSFGAISCLQWTLWSRDLLDILTSSPHYLYGKCEGGNKSNVRVLRVNQGCHGHGKNREKEFFFKVREKPLCKFYPKVSEKSGIFYGWPLGLGKKFMVRKGDAFPLAIE